MSEGLEARAHALKRPNPTRVEIPWPKGWDGLGRLMVQVWEALGGPGTLAPWKSLEQQGRTGVHVRLAADGDGILSTSGDYGAVQGDAVITVYSAIRGDVLVQSHQISDLTMTSLTLEVHAPAGRAEQVATRIRELLKTVG